MNDLVKTYNSFQFNKYKIQIAIDYIIALCKEIPSYNYLINDNNINYLKAIYINFNTEENDLFVKYYIKYKNTNKTLTKYLKYKFTNNNLTEFIPLINMGLCSDDINNLALSLILKNTIDELFIPYINDIIDNLDDLCIKNNLIPMLLYINYDPKHITTISKELNIYKERLHKQKYKLTIFDYYVNFAGKSGMFNSLYISYPSHNWVSFADSFISRYGLHRQYYAKNKITTDNYIELFNIIKLINNILSEFIFDFWFYKSINYIDLYDNLNNNDILPQKTDALYFSECERNINLGYAILNSKEIYNNGYNNFEYLFKNIETALLFNLNSYISLSNGLKQIKYNHEIIKVDINAYPCIIIDLINTILKSSGYYNQYKVFHNLCKKINHKNIGMQHIYSLIDKLEIPNDMKIKIKELKLTECININY